MRGDETEMEGSSVGENEVIRMRQSKEHRHRD